MATIEIKCWFCHSIEASTGSAQYFFYNQDYQDKKFGETILHHHHTDMVWFVNLNITSMRQEW